jgi:hypothetical protein
MAVLVAVTVVGVVLPLLAIVVDLGLTRTFANQSRGAADAGALAAAAAALGGYTDPKDAARHLVEANLPAPDGGWAAAWSSCLDPNPLPAGTDPTPGDCISVDSALKQVRVTVPGRRVPTVFSGVLGTPPTDATATSTASWGIKISPTIGSCVLCVLTSYATGWEKIRVSGADAAIGTSITAAWPGSLQVTNGGITFGTSWKSNGAVLSPLPVKRVAPTDPFAALVAPLQAPVYGQVSNPPPNGPCAPGVYQNISKCTSFGPGTYYVTGSPDRAQTVTLNADANNVLLYLTCSAFMGGTAVAARCPSGQPPHFAGTGTTSGSSHTLTAPGGAGLALVFDQGLSDTATLTGGASYSGTASLTVNGDVYGPNVTLRSGYRAATVNGRVVVNAVNGGNVLPLSTMLVVNTPPAPPPAIVDGAVRLVRSQ